MDIRARSTLLAVAIGILPILGHETGRAATAGRAEHSGACIFNHSTLWTPPNTCRPRARSYPRVVRSPVVKAIYSSALIFGVPYRSLLKVGRCESSLNPHASNGSHFGLFQFAPDTFRRALVQMRAQTGVIAHSYWQPLDASYVAGYLFAAGESRSWTCEGPAYGLPASGNLLARAR